MDWYTGINNFKKGYHSRPNTIKDEKGDLVANSHSILARWRKYFSQLLNVHGVNDVRQKEINTAEPLVPEPSAFGFELAKNHKSPSTDQPQAESIKAAVEKFVMRSINLLFLFGIRRNCLRNGMSRTLHLSIRGAIKQIVVITGAYHFCQLCTKFYSTFCCQS
jgi:hypothetical protein